MPWREGVQLLTELALLNRLELLRRMTGRGSRPGAE